jgi:PilZ domain
VGKLVNLAQPAHKERRKYRRIATDQVISFAPVDERDVLGVGRDVSSGGIRFEAVGCEIDLGDVLRVTFNIGETTVVAVGRVIWSTEIDAISSDVGIEFVEIDPEAQQLIDELSIDADIV